MATIVNTKLGENRGKRRLWLEGAKLAREGYRPDDRYDLDFEGSKVVIKLCNTGKYKVSRRERNGRLIPIIDISNQELVVWDENKVPSLKIKYHP
ncbi:hypothetical protein DFO67_11530 [Modicisalibacter xianhensis]|uniref:Uncharacterized protein n=1 Tax=Modicisalibacter xianhensis TaxID=442341 RepID=A0A4R8FS66_9GAMM|nr:hypothetical protein [Halomonas xianhensis]TDX26765.1 hypothetical protein DFO67_11530 [Halomonas xianhensis]